MSSTVAAKVAKKPLVLTIDVGTSSVRAMLYDAHGHAIHGKEAHRTHQMRSTEDGGIETDALELFGRVTACIDDLLHAAGGLAVAIEAVAPDTFWHNVLGISAQGEPLTPVLTWADTRAAGAAESLRRELDAHIVHERTGCVLHPSYLPAKLRWLQTESPWKEAASHGVRHWLSFAEYMIMRLFGKLQCSISMASGSGLLDQHTCTWDQKMLEAIPISPRTLSELDDAPCRGLLPEFATRWPALAQVPWFPGWGDGATSNVGSGCVSKDKVALMVGTSGAMRVVWATNQVTIPSRLWCYRVDARRVVMGGALSNGGNFIDWLCATLRLPHDRDAQEAAMAKVGPDQAGLTILPFLAGERSTGWHVDARATFSGMSLHTQPEEIFRAGHEAIAYRFALLYQLLRAELESGTDVIASGGALLHSPVWLQMLSDVLETTITASVVPEASSRGAALLALEAIGAISDIRGSDAPMGTAYTPNIDQSKIYRRAAERQRALYDILIEGGNS
jgi:gluconokinase